MVMTIIELIEKKSTYFRQVQHITYHSSPITHHACWARVPAFIPHPSSFNCRRPVQTRSSASRLRSG